MADYFNVEDKVILLTGNTFDLDLQIAEEFALEDAKIAIFSKDADNCEKIAEILEDEYDIEVISSFMDLEDENSVEKGIQKVEDTLGKIDIVVNTALRGSNELLMDRLSTRNIYPLFQISKITEDENVFNMEEKVSIVTGASGYLGADIAQKFAVEGATLVLFSDDEEKLKEDAVRYEKSYDIETSFSVVDLDDENNIKECIENVLNEYDRVDYLVNAAGMGENKNIVDQLITLDKSPLFCVVWLQQFMNL